MVEVVQDGEGVAPGVPRVLRAAMCLQGVAQVGQGLGLLEPVPELGVEPGGVPEVTDGLGMLAQLVIRVADAVQGGGFALLVTEFAVECEGLPAVRQSRRGVAQVGVTPADVVQGVRLARPVTSTPEKPEGLYPCPSACR